MSDIAPVARPFGAGFATVPQAAPHVPRPEQTRKVQPVGTTAPAATLSDRPTTPEEVLALQQAPDRLAPPSMMQLQISAWLESHRDAGAASPGRDAETQPAAIENSAATAQLGRTEDDSG
ncbi:hypothetical protein VK792_03800 [Mesobacterium sp. TK19101]|uniref:Flagellar hook-length control protein FliK n=1 Tax=Mesobacterium hydrothermale TaxID=3111907 RepID=A0ABU6HE60_9RHOB|nr:hypothetical protein [Mesobacterium sp. TK19101]MEC3860397.1 hypothetical protein [Mesobacterium sp. TK19101]